MDLRIRNKIYFEKCIKIVESWLASKEYSLLFETGASDCIYYSTREIVINSRNHSEKRLYILLHECGHLLINSGKRDRIFSLSKNTDAVMGRKATREGRVAVLSEEIEAWKRGERLGNRLGIKINEEKFDKIRADAIISYVEWARD